MQLIREIATPDDLELHLIDLDADDTPLWQARRGLAAEELARADRLRDARDRRRFLLRRMHLRLRLGAWLACDPATVGFAYGVAGKPYLLTGEGGFSVAHSHGHALIALVRHGRVGCDLERIDEGFDWRAAARADVLTPREAAALADQPSAHAFFDLWTLKEAGLKCSGHGLSAPACTVDTGAGAIRGDVAPMHAARVRLHPDYAACVAWTSLQNAAAAPQLMKPQQRGA